MKNLLQNLSLVTCILVTSLSAQTNKTLNDGSVKIDPNDSKATYVNTQNYLSASSLKDYRNYYGDSLKGFNETEVKAELLSRLYYGQEFINVMTWRKRDFIDRKYNLGEYAPKPASVVVPPSKTNSKTIGGQNMVNVAPCVNEGFESTTPGTYLNQANAVTGWTIESTNTNGKQLSCGTPTNVTWAAGSPEFSIVTTPIFGHPYIGNILNSPLGGTNVAVLNNTTPGFVSTRLSTTFPVTSANSVFQFAYAGSWDGSGHQCCDQPFFNINMYDCLGAPLSCSTISLTPPGANCQNGATGYSLSPNNVSWTNWQLKYIDLTPYIGTCVTLRITNGDCNAGAHHGSLYFDAQCGGNVLCSTCTPPTGTSTPLNSTTSFCAGSGQAQITAPTGYATYSWVAPPNTPSISAAQATLQILTIPNPIAGAVYTVNMVLPSGCVFTSTNAIAFSTVNISGIGSAPSCAGGASGTATVIGNGSGTGYNYTWTNATNSVVGTSSVATGLAAGVYTVLLTGIGSAGCGSAVATTTVGTAPPGVTNLVKPFCGNTAYIVTNGGTNYQWYNGSTAIPSNLGGNSPSLTISNPTTGSVVTLRYLSVFGCQDSIRYTLAATNPGFLTANNIPFICPGGNNGSAVINLIPSLGGPSGLNTFNINSIGSTPVYNVNSGPSNLTALPLTGLSAGSYSVQSFDGSCYYSTTFNVNAFTFNYTLSPNASTLCPGNSVQAGVTFTNLPSLYQYSYSWSPTTWLAGNNGNFQSTIISPTVSVGTQSTIVYTVVVTPSIVNCPVTKTISITSIHPAAPSITQITELCNNSAPFQIITTPTGGTFSTAYSGANSPVSLSGLISPSHTNISIGTNTFVYSISINTCVAGSVGSYHVSQFQTAALSSSVPPLCVTNAAFNLMNIVQNTVSGSWSGQGVVNNQFVASALTTNSYPITYSVPSFPNPQACPSSTTINVSVTKTLTPVITAIPEFCTNKPPFTLSVTPTGGAWLPNTGLSNTGLVTPTVITVPNIFATYTVNNGPCLNTKTTTLQISQFIPATLTGSINNLCYNSAPVNLMSIAQNPGGTWTGNNGVISNSFMPSGLATNVYTLTYTSPSSPNTTLCADSKSIAVSLLNPPLPEIIQTAPLCNNASPFLLAVVPGGGHWTANSYLSENGLFTPSLSSVGANAVQYVIGTNTCYRQQTKQIYVEGFVPATILSTLPDLCNTSQALNLTPFTLNNLGTWNGVGISGSSFNPAVTGTGNFTLTYQTASSPSGLCPDNASISVNVFSLAVPALTKAGPFCTSSLPVKLNVSPVGGYFGGSISEAIDNTGHFNPAHALIGDNLITYSITSGPCIAYAQTIIKVEKFISASLEKNPGPFCKTDNAVNLNSYVKNPGGTWALKYPSETGLVGLNMFNPMLAKGDKKTILIYTTFSEPNHSLCPDQQEVEIEVQNNPEVKVTRSGEGLCAPVEYIFTTSSVNNGEGIWSFDDGSEPVKGLSASHLFSKPGIYNVQFDYKNTIGCRALPLNMPALEIHDSPKADFSFPEEIYISDSKISFVNLCSQRESNNYQWQIKDLWESKEMAPSLTFPNIGKYQVKLTATSLYGCKDEITKTIDVKNNFNVFIPNYFSPNFDGINDVFIPVFTKEGIDTPSFEMEIFDRWGHLVYASKDINKGWDGSVANKDEKLKEDTYVYKIKYKDAEGKQYEKIGNISLLK